MLNVNTPTPGDLSARLPELPDHDVKGVHFDGYSADQMRAYAIAALSALPAGGDSEADELIRALGFDPERFRTEGGAINHYRLRAAIRNPDDYAGLATPPPADAAPRLVDSFARKAEQMQPADANVGAQGEGDDRAMLAEAAKMLRADGFTRFADAIARLAAPAAGMGVDDAMVERYLLAECQAINGDDSEYFTTTDRDRAVVRAGLSAALASLEAAEGDSERDKVFALSNWLHNERPEAERALWAGDLVRIVRLLAAPPAAASDGEGE